MASKAEITQAEARFGELQVLVKSRILERLAKDLSSDRAADATMYTKSDGKNYGMYQKSEAALTEIYERLFTRGVGNRQFSQPPGGYTAD